MKIYKLHPLKGDREGTFALDLGRKLGYRLIIKPLKDDGCEWDEKNIDLIYKSTKIILIMEVSNHYE